ncbi:MAG TPA: methylaspartate mutase subunit S [Firmicutes bacterium]|nr:methylaspartate mutase subunit S [Bacillota bacterium]
MEKGPCVVMGVIGADVHAVGNRILDYALRQAGFQVVNLGIMVAQEEFIRASIETAARAILVSSLYGHGEIDCRGLRQKCIEAGLDQILLYVGGNLVVGNRDWREVEKTFRNMGFDRVAPPGTRPEEVVAFLRQDLGWPPYAGGEE